MKTPKEIPVSVLEDLYVKRGLPLRQIAKLLNISDVTVRKRFKEYGLVKRAHGSWMIKYEKAPFDGNKQLKAYIMGFRVGDLNVYTPSPTANIVIARTNSTHTAQIEVMRLLFGKYGGIKVVGKGQSKNVNCYLDKSFSFLLIKKPYLVEKWIKRDRRNSLAFIAGYIDAEGNFIINQGRARFKLDSYDYDILVWMHEWLLAQGVKSKLRLLGKKGDVRYGGGYWNGDLWRININEANSLYSFCKDIIPYLHHAKRINDVNKCLVNIRIRRSNGTI